VRAALVSHIGPHRSRTSTTASRIEETVMKKWQVYAAFALSVGLAAAVLSTTNAQAAPQGNGETKLNCDNAPCDSVARGRVAFNERNLRELGGNGRACADCHMPSDSFQLSPATARARFEALSAKLAHNKNADDPLFRPVDADDFRVNGDNANDFSNLVENGLVRVTMPLPLNVKVVDPATGQPSGDTSVDLWRAVMPVLNVSITGPDFVLPLWAPAAQQRLPILGQDPNGPNRQGGYQHDARFATLQEQARGALFAHAQVTVEPTPGLLDDLAAFQETLFSSQGVEALADAIRSGSSIPDPDPELNQLEQDGKRVFNRACAQCHGGALHPSTSTGDATLVRPIARYHPIATACPRPTPTASCRVRSG
jgi:mono/diheme cytochrome c family protein